MKKGLIVFLIGVLILSIYFLFTSDFWHKEPVHQGLWHCPMHTSYISKKPGKCPICHMDLVPIPADDPHASHDLDQVPDKKLARVKVGLSKSQEQLINIKTASVALRPMQKIINVPGTIVHDPELYTALVEYQQARGSEFEIPAMNKLHHMGLSHAQIVEYAAYPEEKLKNFLFAHNQNLKVWAYLQVYESEIGLIKVGQSVKVQSESAPGEVLTGVVMSIDQRLDTETRTIKVRVLVQNKDQLLLPEMFVQAQILVNAGQKLTLPADAVLDTGLQKIVFVKSAPGVYEPREILTGLQSTEWIEVKKGLMAGTTVATSGLFLLDSESKIKAVNQVSHVH